MNIIKSTLSLLIHDMIKKSYWCIDLYKCNSLHSETPSRCFVIDHWVNL